MGKKSIRVFFFLHSDEDEKKARIHASNWLFTAFPREIIPAIERLISSIHVSRPMYSEYWPLVLRASNATFIHSCTWASWLRHSCFATSSAPSIERHAPPCSDIHVLSLSCSEHRAYHLVRHFWVSFFAHNRWSAMVLIRMYFNRFWVPVDRKSSYSE